MGNHEVVVLGFKLNGPDSPARVLARVLGVSVEEARSLARSFPVVVAEALAPEDAEALAARLREGGARVALGPKDQGARAPSPAPAGEPAPQASDPAHAVAPAPPPRAHERSPGATPHEDAAAPEPFRLGTLRIPVRERAPLEGMVSPEPSLAHAKTEHFVVGPLAIPLASAPEPVPLAAPEVTAPAAPPAPAIPGESGVRMLDDTFEPEAGDAPPLLLDTDALADRRTVVSGGRKDPKARTSLMDIPLKVVRRARMSLRPSASEGRRAPLGSLSLLVTAAVALLSGGYWAATRGAALGQSVVVQAAQADGETGPTERAAGHAEEAVHPLLKLAPKPMEAPLAAILRRKVSGVHSVSVDWGEEGAPDPSAQCMLVSGSSAERSDRVAALMQTGKRFRPSSGVEDQLRDHEESLRMAKGDEQARYTQLCLTN